MKTQTPLPVTAVPAQQVPGLLSLLGKLGVDFEPWACPRGCGARVDWHFKRATCAACGFTQHVDRSHINPHHQ